MDKSSTCQFPTHRTLKREDDTGDAPLTIRIQIADFLKSGIVMNIVRCSSEFSSSMKWEFPCLYLTNLSMSMGALIPARGRILLMRKTPSFTRCGAHRPRKSKVSSHQMAILWSCGLLGSLRTSMLRSHQISRWSKLLERSALQVSCCGNFYFRVVLLGLVRYSRCPCTATL